MKTIAAVYIICFISALQLVHGAASCNAQTRPALIQEEIADPDYTFDFDVVPTNFSGIVPLNVTAGPLTSTLQGSEFCGVFFLFGLGVVQWRGGDYWDPNNTTKVGTFLGLNARSNVYCEIIFSEPISQFSMRVASDEDADAGLYIYDEADQQLNCNLFPSITSLHNNAYYVRGFNSTGRKIKKIVLKDSFAAADVLSFRRCINGIEYTDGECVGQIEEFEPVAAPQSSTEPTAVPISIPVSSPIANPTAPLVAPTSTPVASRPTATPTSKTSGSETMFLSLWTYVWLASVLLIAFGYN